MNSVVKLKVESKTTKGSVDFNFRLTLNTEFI